MKLQKNNNYLGMRGKNMEQVIEEYGISVVLFMVGIAVIVGLISMFFYL